MEKLFDFVISTALTLLIYVSIFTFIIYLIAIPLSYLFGLVTAPDECTYRYGDKAEYSYKYGCSIKVDGLRLKPLDYKP